MVLKDCFVPDWKYKCPLLVVKKCFSCGLSTDSSCSAKLKEIASGKMFDLINFVGETETPKGQRICKVFGLSEGKLSVHLEVD